MVSMPKTPFDWGDDLDPGFNADPGEDTASIDRGFLVPAPYWVGDEGFSVRTSGGILDGLPEPHGGSGLQLLMSPQDIASIDSPGTGNADEHMIQDSAPIPQKAEDNNPRTRSLVPYDKTSEDRRSVAGKIWNLPNSAIGMAYGGLGYLTGWPSKWLGLQENAPGITTGNNAVQFTDNPFGGVGAITLGNVQVINGKPTGIGDDGNFVGPHEEQHTYQGEQLGPLYLPSNIFGGLAGVLIDGNWHGSHNWNEAGPQQQPPVPWSK